MTALFWSAIDDIAAFNYFFFYFSTDFDKILTKMLVFFFVLLFFFFKIFNFRGTCYFVNLPF